MSDDLPEQALGEASTTHCHTITTETENLAPSNSGLVKVQVHAEHANMIT